ncbi:MAG: abortive infection family protein [Candidatus Cloacimonetes bacterium]|nr:abortive infection family protein [Candidatus Cloacimonadota bacterium]
MKFADGGAVCKLTRKGIQRLIEIDQKSKSDKNKVVVMKKNSNFSETMLKALKSAEDEISKGNPDLSHDRMHTFLHDYLKQVCKKLSFNPKKQKPDIMELFSLIQKHLNKLNPNDITIKIFRVLSKALDGINDIRNNMSLTHPNPVLGKPEAMFVINTIKTIYVYLEEKLK